TKIMLLDASRPNPSWMGTDQRRGLAQMKAPKGTVIGSATQPDTAASRDPLGGLSPYAKALHTYMSVKGLDLLSMLTEAGLDVMRATNDRQRPWFASSISERVTLTPPSASTPGVVGSTRADLDRRVGDAERPPPGSDPALVAWLQDAHKQLI